LKFLFKVWIIQEIIEVEKSQKFIKNLENLSTPNHANNIFFSNI